ncbi:MAG: chorismate--pyruvate lyase [Lachnoclostridium sp.]
MEFVSYKYVVERIDGDYAMLKNLEDETAQLKQVARALLLPEINPGQDCSMECCSIRSSTDGDKKSLGMSISAVIPV